MKSSFILLGFSVLLKVAFSSDSDGNTPFSCCSMKSLSPCIHHNIEATGKAYLYTPEYNLSISTRGCYEMIREKKQEIGWGIVLNLFIYFCLQVKQFLDWFFSQFVVLVNYYSFVSLHTNCTFWKRQVFWTRSKLYNLALWIVFWEKKKRFV